MGRMSDLHIEIQEKLADEDSGLTVEEYMETKQYEDEHDAQTIEEVKDKLKEMISFYKEKSEWERGRVYKAWRDNPEVREQLAYTKRWRLI